MAVGKQNLVKDAGNEHMKCFTLSLRNSRRYLETNIPLRSALFRFDTIQPKLSMVIVWEEG